MSVSQGGVDGTHASLPSPLFSVAPGGGINHGAVCFGEGNLGNRFQDEALDMKENLKAIEENGTHPVLAPAASGFWCAPTADLTWCLWK